MELTAREKEMATRGGLHHERLRAWRHCLFQLVIAWSHEVQSHAVQVEHRAGMLHGSES